MLLRRWRVPEEQGGTALHFAVCAALAAALAGATGGWSAWPGWTPRLAFWVIFGGVGPVGLAYHFWEIGVKRGNVRLIVQLAYFIPVGSSLLISLSSAVALAGPGGAALIAAGAWISRRRRAPLTRGGPGEAFSAMGVVRPAGFEPAAYGFVVRRSIQLS